MTKQPKIQADEPKNHLITRNMFQPALSPRGDDAHKGLFGNIAIVGGDTGTVGAVLLAARAALHCGAGRVYATLLAQDCDFLVDTLQPEIMLQSPVALSKMVASQQLQLDCVVIGTGLGKSELALDVLKFWLSHNVPLLIDADALNLIAENPTLVTLCEQRHARTIITPHPGEAARLLDVDTSFIQQNRVDCALKLAKLLNTTCVLKGAGTICAQPDGRWHMNTTGNAGLASAGTGDVLSGIIGALVAQGLAAIDATKLGVYVHGAAADALVLKGIGPVGLTASEVLIEARNIINQLNDPFTPCEAITFKALQLKSNS